jgi:lipopolysaccharide export system permease protein
MLFKRSLIHELATNITGALCVLLGIVSAQRLTYLFGLAASGRIPNNAIDFMLGFSILKFLPMLLGLAMFLSALLTLSRWHRDSEMVIWFNSGLSNLDLIRPVLTFAIPVTVIIALLSLFVSPWATNKGEEFLNQIKSRDDFSTITAGVFKESKIANRVFFIESFSDFGALANNIFAQSLQNNKLGIMIAKHGNRVTANNGDTFLVLRNGRRYEGVPDTSEFTTTEFETYSIRLEPHETSHPPLITQALSSNDLLQNSNPKKNAEMQWRIAIPISALLLTLMAIPLSFVNPRAGNSATLLLALPIYIIYSNLLSIIQAMVGQSKINTLIGLWPVHIIFLLLTIYLFHRSIFLGTGVGKHRK